jgi:hypothetical protein
MHEIARMDPGTKFAEALKLAANGLDGELKKQIGAQIQALTEPANIAIMTGFLSVAVAGQFTPAGPFITVGIGLLGLAAFGTDAIEVSRELYLGVSAALGATTQDDLDEAGRYLATGLARAAAKIPAAAITTVAGAGAIGVAGRIRKARRPGATVETSPGTNAPYSNHENAGALKKITNVDQNVAKVALRKLKNDGDAAAIEYLKSKGVSEEVARDAVKATKVKPPALPNEVPPGVYPREYYMGRTPRIDEGVGKQVLARMIKDGDAVIDSKTGETLIRSIDPKTGEPGWYKLSDCQMGHKEDAVKWWNEEGRFYPSPDGRPAPEVRAWMEDPKNYVIEFEKHNLAKGAMTKNEGHRYLPRESWE